MKILKKLKLKKEWVGKLNELRTTTHVEDGYYHYWLIETYKRAIGRLNGEPQDGWDEEYLKEIRNNHNSKMDLEYREYILDFIIKESKGIGFYKLGPNLNIKKLTKASNHNDKYRNISNIRKKITYDVPLIDYMEHCLPYLEFCDRSHLTFDKWKRINNNG